MNETHDHESGTSTAVSRRALLVGGGVVAAGMVGYPIVRNLIGPRGAAFIARNQSYDGPLARTIRDGLLATGFDPAEVAGRRVLLKPNLVEPTRAAPHMTTHPALVVAAAEVFLGWKAVVTVGEGPGHVRDTELALDESGLAAALAEAAIPFADLNYQEVAWVRNAGRACDLDGFYFPKSVVEADIVVSMPKMKTHHWMGVTASMKNLYGVIPGSMYGWPKNVLHHKGIPETVFDINASLPRTLAIVDGIECMEGDGPIMGSPKSMGLVVVGTNLVAVDATVSRLMCLRPERVTYLGLAADRLGPISEARIEQRGETWKPLARPFSMLDRPHLQVLRDRRGALVS